MAAAVVRARRAIVRRRSRRYPAVPCTSPSGATSVMVAAAAATRVGSSGTSPIRRDSAASARMGVGPAPSRAIAARRQTPASSTMSVTAAPARQWCLCLRENSAKAAPVRSGWSGTSMPTSSSSGAIAVRPRSTKNSRHPRVRSPRTECSSNSAPSATRAAGSSEFGSAFTTLPPTVPRLRICGCATHRTASCSSGQRAANSAECSSSACRVMAPIRRPRQVSCRPARPVTRLMSTIRRGVTERMFNSGTSD